MTDLSHDAEKPEISACDDAASTKPIAPLTPLPSLSRFEIWFNSVLVRHWLENDLDHLNEHMLKDIGQGGRQPQSRRFKAARQASLPLHMMH